MKRLFLAALVALPLYMNAQEKDKPLNKEQVEKENAATAEAEKTVAGEKTQAEEAIEQGKEIVVNDTAKLYSSTSVAENSGFARTVGFDGTWKIDLNLENKEIILTGGTLNNMDKAVSPKLLLTVYYADKKFDLKNPEMIGTPYGQIEVDPIEAGAKKEGQSYIIPLALETPPAAGNYIPYITLSSQDASTQQFGVIDVKLFNDPVALP